MTIRFSSLLGALGLGLGLTLAGPVRAQIPINLASNNGNASTQTATYGITPSAGTQQFLLTTINPAASLPAYLGTTPANTNVASLNTYFGLAAGTLGAFNAQDGSGYLSQQVTLTIGSVVSFDYIFLTSEDNSVAYNNDRAFFTVNGAINTTLRTAGQLTSAEQAQGSNALNFDFQSRGTLTSGYTRLSYTVPATGNYTFGFGVIDVATTTVQSGLLIDNLNYSVIPEPGTGALLALSAAGAAAAARTARRRSCRA